MRMQIMLGIVRGFCFCNEAGRCIKKFEGGLLLSQLMKNFGFNVWVEKLAEAAGVALENHLAG